MQFPYCQTLSFVLSFPHTHTYSHNPTCVHKHTNIHTYTVHTHTHSGTERTLKVGDVTKSRPIDPFLDVYPFLNVRFEQKVFKLTHFWMPSPTF